VSKITNILKAHNTRINKVYMMKFALEAVRQAYWKMLDLNEMLDGEYENDLKMIEAIFDRISIRIAGMGND